MSSPIQPSDSYLDDNEFTYIFWLYEIYRKIQTVPGHVVEIGVARGRNSIIFGQLIKLSGEHTFRRYYGFDTFSGYTADDLTSSPHLSQDSWKNTTKEFVEDRLKQLDLSRICTITEGDIKQTAPKFVSERGTLFQPGKLKISLLYIDCNAYLPSIFAMDFFKDYMSPGGIICVDEKLQGGETEALAEFCKKNDLEFKRDAGPFCVPAYTVVK